jgi:hypothetical protein
VDCRTEYIGFAGNLTAETRAAGGMLSRGSGQACLEGVAGHAHAWKARAWHPPLLRANGVAIDGAYEAAAAFVKSDWRRTRPHDLGLDGKATNHFMIE